MLEEQRTCASTHTTFIPKGASFVVVVVFIAVVIVFISAVVVVVVVVMVMAVLVVIQTDSLVATPHTPRKRHQMNQNAITPDLKIIAVILRRFFSFW